MTEPTTKMEELFAAGNFAAVAANGPASDWMTYAALGLVGRGTAALEGLRRFDHIDARFYAGVACWVAGEEQAAAELLEGVPTPYARNLLALIRKPVIRVLAQLPWTRRGAQDLLSGAASEGRFLLQNISFHPDDLRNEPYGNIHRYYDSRQPPDFYMCAMVEWHLIPPNLQELPCPVLGQTADYDLHIQTIVPWLRAFDALVVTDPTEWEDVRRLTQAPVFTFPKSFVLPETLPPIPTGRRRYDVLQTGTVLHPYYPDKAALFHQMLADPNLRVLFLNGFLGDQEYQQLLGATKVVPTYVRHSGAMPTRGLEALSMGCAVVTQAGSVLSLYAGEEEGVSSYDPQRGDLPAVLRRLVDAWPETLVRARRGAGIVRRAFGAKQVASEYLRFLTFLAARPRPERRPVPVAHLDQRRRVIAKGWLPGDEKVLQAAQERTLPRLRETAAAEPGPRTLNNVARELVLTQALDTLLGMTSEVSGLVSTQVLAFYRAAIERYPRSIVLRFNYARSAFHLGGPQEVLAALRVAGLTLDASETDWEIDTMEDVFPWDFGNTYFNYRAYFDLVTEEQTSGLRVGGKLVRLIRASLAFYLGHYTGELRHFRTAITLDPTFPYYKMCYARALLDTSLPAQREEAQRLLQELAHGSMLYVEAAALLEHYFPGGGPGGRSRWQHDDRDVVIREFNRVWPLRPALHPLTVPSEDENTCRPLVKSGAVETDGPEVAGPARPPHVSALVTVYRAERFMRGLIEDLERQTVADRLEIVIVDSNSPENERGIVEEFQRRYDNIVYIRTEERENSHVALNRAIRAARGTYVTLANADDRHRPDAFEKMVAVLEARQAVALVYADSAITDQEDGTLDTARIMGHFRLPDFDRRLLFRGCCVGPQPMWRRALHERHGDFDPEYEICGDYEFWLRIGVKETFLHIPEVLGLYLMSPTSNERVNRIRRHQETERARRKHWPKEWGELPPWDADYNVMLDVPTTGEPGTTGANASRTTTAGSSPASRPDEESDMSAGHLALEQRAWPQACAAFIRVLERDKNCAPARSGLGLALMASGETEEGLAQLQEAVRVEPSPDHVCNLTTGLIHLGRVVEAERLLRGILDVVPGHEAARANLDALLAARGTGTGATLVSSPLSSGKEEIARQLEGAARHMSAKRWPEAVEGFRAVLAVAPDLAEARAALGSALLVLGRTEEAIVELQQAAERLNTSEAWNNLGWAEATAGHPEPARTALIKAIECDAENLEPQRNLAALFETLKMPREAEAAYDLILLTAPGDAEAVKGKARCAGACGARGVGKRQVAETVLVHG